MAKMAYRRKTAHGAEPFADCCAENGSDAETAKSERVWEFTSLARRAERKMAAMQNSMQ